MIKGAIEAEIASQDIHTVNDKFTLAFSIGGSSIRCYVIDGQEKVSEDPLFKFEWIDYKNFVSSLAQEDLESIFPNFNAISNISSGHLFSEYITLLVASGLVERGILPSAIKMVGVCYAGDLKDGVINTNNIPIELKDLIVNEDIPSILGALNIFPRSIVFKHDSVASLDGELHPVYGELKEGTGVSMIMGTGFNGALLINGIKSNKFLEIGYALQVDKNFEVELNSWEALQKDPMMYDSAAGRLIASPDGKDYIENHLAGEGLSISFFEFIKDNPRSLSLIKRVPHLYLAYKEFAQSQAPSLFLKVKDLEDEKDKFRKANIALTRILKEELETEFGEVVKEYFIHNARILGKALRILKSESGLDDLKFVFGGGIAENIPNVRFFWDEVESIAQLGYGNLIVSKYEDGGVREAHAFTDGFQFPEIIRVDGEMHSISKNDEFFNFYVESHKKYQNENFTLNSIFSYFNVEKIPLPDTEEKLKDTPSLYKPHVGHGGWVGELQASVDRVKEGLQDGNEAISKLNKINLFFEDPSIEAFIKVVKAFSGGDTLSRAMDHLLASGYSVDFLNLLMQGRQIYVRVEKLDEAIKCSAFGELLQDFSDRQKKVLL